MFTNFGGTNHFKIKCKFPKLKDNYNLPPKFPVPLILMPMLIDLIV